MYSVNFTETQLSVAEDLAFRAALEVAPTLRENFGKTDYTTKSSERDWVTQWDEWAEEKITERLSAFDSQVGILGEEAGASGDQEVYWTIDAIDGTGGFVRGIDTCTTMLALVDNGKPVVSVIYDFIRDVPYTAIAGAGAYQNLVRRLSVSTRAMPTAYIETYIPLDTEVGAEASSRIRSAGAFILQSASAGHMFTGIARGATEGFISLQNPYASIWDYAPGALLVHEAGGVVTNVNSDSYTVNNPDFIASNQQTYGALREIVCDL
jgi:myo-inositol-1(or 4)-monophosphatase